MTLIVLQAVAPADTVVAVAARDTVDWLFAAAAVSVVLCTLALFVALGFIVVLARRMGRSIGDMKQKVSADPAMASLRRTAENVSSMSETVRGQVERLSESVGKISDQITLASIRIEERMDQLNALLEVVQSEAEDRFVDSAAAARGVRAGLGALKDGARSRQDGRGRRQPLDVHPDDALLGDLGDNPDEGSASKEKQ